MQVTQWNLSYQRQFLGRMMVDVTYTGSQHQQHLARLRGEPGDLHPGQLRGRPVRADRRRAPARTRAPPTGRRARSSRCSTRPKARTTASTASRRRIDEGTGSYNGVRFGAAEAPEQRLERERQLHLSKCINQGEPGTDIGNTFPVPLIDPYHQPAAGSDDERRPVRRGPAAQLQPVGGDHQPAASAAASSGR